jgi:hypothetical protein
MQPAAVADVPPAQVIVAVPATVQFPWQVTLQVETEHTTCDPAPTIRLQVPAVQVTLAFVPVVTLHVPETQVKSPSLPPV